MHEITPAESIYELPTLEATWLLESVRQVADLIVGRVSLAGLASLLADPRSSWIQGGLGEVEPADADLHCELSCCKTSKTGHPFDDRRE